MRTTSVRLADDVVARLDRLGEKLSRPRSWLIARAVERYLEYEEWFVEAVNEGVRSADAGRVAEHEKVKDWVESWGTDEEGERPPCGE
ncbi:MAG: ribbon-helix-helix protein, CopG family [Deltaproteobacteria bacterium]|nr:ribbon-helix-helix protein, CopG family [Deltaproteobacteria bacterium]